MNGRVAAVRRAELALRNAESAAAAELLADGMLWDEEIASDYWMPGGAPWSPLAEDQPLPDCTCGHSLAAHARNGASPCTVHGCECRAWQLSPDDTGGSDY